MKRRTAKRRVAVLHTSVATLLEDVREELRASMDLAANAAAVEAAAASLGYEASSLPFGEEPGALCARLRGIAPDIVFNLSEGPLDCPQKEPHGAALLELLRLPYTGNGPFALSLCNDKPLAKDMLEAAGIRTPARRLFTAVPRGGSAGCGLRFPVIVKPAREDGSAGISEESVVENERDLRKRVTHVIERFRQEALAEEFVAGREFNVALLGNGSAADPYRALPPGELAYKDPRWRVCSYESKWDPEHPSYDAISPVVPAKISAALGRRLQGVALSSARLFALRGYARVDFRMDEEGNLYVLEVNPNPDISPDAGMARAARAAGLDYAALVGEVIRLGLALGVR